MADADDGFDWTPPPLSDSDAALCRAYAESGPHPDDLGSVAYTPTMVALAAAAGYGATQDELHRCWCALVRLNKQGRLAGACAARRAR